MNSVNVDLAVRYVKTITDNHRCLCCDHLLGRRVRYPCGHSVCENCVVTAEDCLLCLSPPDVSNHVIDGPLSLRVEHVSKLLHTFQDLFKLDVYKRQKISDQLKLEKELFPECIQAHSKYHNSRRRSNISFNYKVKRDRSSLPGEIMSRSETSKMKNTISYVQQWLNKNESLKESKINLPRRPFTDLNVNVQNVPISKISNKVSKWNNAPIRNKTRIKTYNSKVKNKLKLYQAMSEKHESGIVIDDEALIVSDSQSDCNDKDKMAWLAVLEAEKNNSCDKSYSTLNKKELKEIRKLDNRHKLTNCQCGSYKVPFYKRSSLIKAIERNNNIHNENKINQMVKNNNVTITIDNNSYVTTISFITLDNNLGGESKQSVEVQTENNIKFKSNCHGFAETVELSRNENNGSSCMAIADEKPEVDKNSLVFKKCDQVRANDRDSNQPVKQPKCLIIEESDADSDMYTEKDNPLEVTAEVHRSETENDCNVLFQLDQGEYEHRKKRSLRGKTPASSDSSDKENYDPNRAKRQKLEKKCFSKK